MSLPNIYIKDDCGSFCKHGWKGTDDDLITGAVIACSENGDTACMSFDVSSDFMAHLGNFGSDAVMLSILGMPVTINMHLPSETLRIMKGGRDKSHLLAELSGWTP